MICLSIVLLVCSLIGTEQLTCSTNCSNVYARPNGSIRPNTCLKTVSDICKAQIIVYYKGKIIPNYFNYTFGFTGEIQEKEHQRFIRNYGLINFTEYQFIVNVKRDETIVIADIYCTNTDDCGLIELQQLVQKYTKQINPSHHFKSSIYSDSSPTKLICYDSKSETNIQCSTSHNPVCISNSTDSIRECSSGLDVHVHYKFTISSPDIIASKRAAELIICNKDYCNSENILMKLESIARNYTSGGNTSKNTGNSNSQHTLFGFLLIIFYCIVLIYLR